MLDPRSPPPPIRKAVLDTLTGKAEKAGLDLPWSKTRGLVSLRPGELSIWAGFNGHGKSTILGQIMLWASREMKVGSASFEMPLEKNMVMLAKMAAGSNNPDTRFVNDLMTYCANRLYIWNRVGRVPANEVLSGVFWMAETLGCELVVLDNLSMCGVSNDIEAETEFAATLTGIAKSLGIHIALVHHMRKPQQGDERKVPNKFDVRGAGGITDMADSVFVCWANKRKKRLENAPVRSREEEDEWREIENAPDFLLGVEKQRWGEFEGRFALWQHSSRQYTPNRDRRPLPFEIPRMEEVAA